MIQRRMATREAVGPDNRPLIGRGYELLDETGAVLRGPSLEPGSGGEVAVVSVRPSTPAEHGALKQRAFGLDQSVVLRIDDDGAVAMLDAEGALRAGNVVEGSAEETAELLRSDPDRTAWVCWEWLTEDGREHVDVALSSAEERPQPLPAPSVSTAGVDEGSSAGPARWVWLGLAAALVIAVVALLLLG